MLLYIINKLNKNKFNFIDYQTKIINIYVYCRCKLICKLCLNKLFNK